MKDKNYYISTPIYYPSAEFHIGHCYTTISADAIARYKRLQGYNVYFQTGCDEHGQKIENIALKHDVSPKEYVDRIVSDAKDLWQKLRITYDYFIRTTDDNHIKSVQEIFKKLYDQGDIYKNKYKGLYCVSCEAFWTAQQAKGNICPDCGKEITEIEEEAYFFKLSKYQQQLEKYYENHPNFLLPISRKNEMLNNFIKPGLKDLCVSRTSFKWGIPVSFDNKHVIYVWVDALSNYITSLGYPDINSNKFKNFWPADLHLVGKEIVRFHAIIWPCLLFALDLPLPKQIFGHGWLIIEGEKISKSLGNYKDPREYIKEYGVDAVRYYVLREVSFGNDGNFSVESLVQRTNSDLANTLGNLVNRTISMNNKYFDGLIYKVQENDVIDEALIAKALNLAKCIEDKLQELKINEALEIIFDFLRDCNKYIDETMPWVLAKDDSKINKLKTVLYNLLESIRISAVLLSPFIPSTSEKIFKQLNTKEISYESIKQFNGLKDGEKVGTPEILFERIEKDVNR